MDKYFNQNFRKRSISPIVGVLLFFISSLGLAQNYSLDWYYHIGSLNFETVSNMKEDKNGDLIVLGRFEGTVDFSPSSTGGVRTVNMSSSSADSEAYILKISKNGEFVWVRTFGGLITDMLISESNDIVLVGNFQDTAYYDPETSSDYLYSSGGTDGFILIIDDNGNIQWSKAVGGENEDEISLVCETKTGNLVFAGQLTGPCQLGTGGSDPVYSGSRKFILMTTNEYELIDIKTLGERNGGDISFKQLRLDLEGNILLLGSFRGQVFLDTDSSETITSIGNYDIFLTKFNKNLSQEWYIHFGSTSFDVAGNINVLNNSKLLISGGFWDTIDFNPSPNQEETISPKGYQDAFLLFLDKNGEFLQIGTMGSDNGGYTYPRIIEEIEGNNVLMLVNVDDGTTDIDPRLDNEYFTQGEGIRFIHFTNELTPTNVNAFGHLPVSFMVRQGNKLRMAGSIASSVSSVFDLDPSSQQVLVEPVGNRDVVIFSWNYNSWPLSSGRNKVNRSHSFSPNPGKGDFLIQGVSSEIITRLEVIDHKGAQVMYSLDQEKLSVHATPGVYTVVYETLDGRIETQKLVITP